MRSFRQAYDRAAKLTDGDLVDEVRRLEGRLADVAWELAACRLRLCAVNVARGVVMPPRFLAALSERERLEHELARMYVPGARPEPSLKISSNVVELDEAARRRRGR